MLSRLCRTKNWRRRKHKKQLPPSTQDSIYTYTFNNKVTLAANEQRKGDKENLTHDTSTNFDQKGIHEALKHILSVLTEAITTKFDYTHFLKHYQTVQS